MNKTHKPLAGLLIAGLVLTLGLAACGDSTATPTAPAATVASGTTAGATAGATGGKDGGVGALQDLGKNLTAANDALKKNDIPGAVAAYKIFDDKWNDVETFIQVQSKDSYAAIEDAMTAVGRDLLRTANPVAATALTDLATLQQKYNDGIALVQKAVANHSGPDVAPISGADVDAATSKVSDYLKGGSDKLVSDVTAFVAAVKSHDIDKSKATYQAARFDYEGIEFLAEDFSDADSAIDARADDFPEGESDPNWTGFHPLEKAIYVDGKLDSRTDQLADQLLKDVTTLRDKIKTINIDPTVALSGALELIEEIQTSKITGEEERYGHTDLNDFRANLSSAKTVYDTFAPFVKQRDAALDASVTSSFNDVQTSIAGFFDANNVAQDYSKVDDATRKTVAQKVEALAANFAKVPGTLGLKAQG